MRKPALSAALLLATLTVSGCGDGVDKSAYVASVSRVQQETQTSAKEVSDKMQKAKTPGEIGDDLNELAADITANAKSLDAIEAPESVADQHQDYVTLMNRFGTDLQALATKVKASTPDNVRGVLTDASKLTTDLSTNEQKIVSEINTALQS